MKLLHEKFSSQIASRARTIVIFSSYADVNRHRQQSPKCLQAYKKVFGATLKAHQLKRANGTTSQTSGAEMESDPDAEETEAADPIDIDAVAPAARMVEVEDEDAPGRKRKYWKQPYPTHRQAGAKVGKGRTKFERIHDEQVLTDAKIWGPFQDEEEWELAKWLIKNVGHGQADSLI